MSNNPNRVEQALIDSLKPVLTNGEVRQINEVHQCVSYDHLNHMLKEVKKKDLSLINFIKGYNCNDEEILRTLKKNFSFIIKCL